DTITAGGSADTITGGGGHDVISGGGGADRFVFGVGASPVAGGLSGVATITHWSTAGGIDLTTAGGPRPNHAETTAADFAAAQAAADTAMNGTIFYVAV